MARHAGERGLRLAAIDQYLVPVLDRTKKNPVPMRCCTKKSQSLDVKAKENLLPVVYKR